MLYNTFLPSDTNTCHCFDFGHDRIAFRRSSSGRPLLPSLKNLRTCPWIDKIMWKNAKYMLKHANKQNKTCAFGLTVPNLNLNDFVTQRWKVWNVWNVKQLHWNFNKYEILREHICSIQYVCPNRVLNYALKRVPPWRFFQPKTAATMSLLAKPAHS